MFINLISLATYHLPKLLIYWSEVLQKQQSEILQQGDGFS